MGESVPPSETALDRRLIQFNHLPKRLRAVGADKVFRFENWRERRDSDYFGSAARAAFNAASAPAEMPVPPASRYFQPSLIRFSTSLAFTRIPHGTLCARHDFKQACNAASRSGDFMDILQTFDRFDHDDGQQVALGVERPQIGALLVFSRIDAPEPKGVAWAIAAESGGLHVLRAFELRIAHVANHVERLFLGIDSVGDVAHNADIQRLLHHPDLLLPSVGREASDRSDARLGVAFTENRRLVDHSDQEVSERLEIH